MRLTRGIAIGSMLGMAAAMMMNKQNMNNQSTSNQNMNNQSNTQSDNQNTSGSSTIITDILS